jgi:dolichyl-phosphate-mannose--protein O-mannosyl transferase
MVAAIAAAIFVVAHLLLMIGLTTPDKIAFDEVHYVPAAKQLLEKGPYEPLLNPMHPPLAKQFMALSIRVFGDNPLGWRYPSAVFGALAIVAMYLCGLALFASQGAALATAALTFLNQMVFVQSRIAMLDIYALAFDPRSSTATTGKGPRSPSALPVWPSALPAPANGAASFRSALRW